MGTSRPCQSSLNSTACQAVHSACTTARTFIDRHTTLLLVRFDLIPEHHAHLPILERAGDVNLTVLLEFLNGLWRLLPALFESSNRETAAFACLALDLSQESSLISHIEIMLQRRGAA